ncbi:2-amino-4-hydroxy-6-hydroxymethyldihydropteridine diphosphokinase [Nitrosophilus alvini]|uniref:2-amino-4-hydroxy-6- hydroxymethyldihydropteridine diphosphokinase n=1 Tax=Nitrosophilus alvini TaxID=2714855 RepID=UPI001F335A46|nr:2-amino-4-hydroxy-6-hydroxymethyldihydropteridine diphosphokinase [Nitrosophilus alvini]
MIKNLSGELVLYYCNLFPYVSKKCVKKRNSVLIGIGGNIGDVKRRFKKLLFRLQKNPKISVEATSPILKNPPFGFLEQNDFFNGVIKLSTDMNMYEFLKYVLYLEKSFGRVRTFKNAPRTLDIDIIFFNNIKIDKKNLQIPHPKWKERESVVIPLLYLRKGVHK